jgi:RimJ/RimL family protein N-acetyltransferase
LLRTERLLLRKPTLDDVEDAARLLSDPEVMRFLGGEPVPPDAVANVVRRWADDWETYPAGKFIVEMDGAMIGRVGLNFFDTTAWERSTAEDAQPELGWALAREHWGKGYATEAAAAVRDWFGADRLISLIAPGNLRSQRVAARLGARPTETVELPDGGPHLVWVHPQ